MFTLFSLICVVLKLYMSCVTYSVFLNILCCINAAWDVAIRLHCIWMMLIVDATMELSAAGPKTCHTANLDSRWSRFHLEQCCESCWMSSSSSIIISTRRKHSHYSCPLLKKTKTIKIKKLLESIAFRHSSAGSELWLADMWHVNAHTVKMSVTIGDRFSSFLELEA